MFPPLHDGGGGEGMKSLPCPAVCVCREGGGMK